MIAGLNAALWWLARAGSRSHEIAGAIFPVLVFVPGCVIAAFLPQYVTYVWMLAFGAPFFSHFAIRGGQGGSIAGRLNLLLRCGDQGCGESTMLDLLVIAAVVILIAIVMLAWFDMADVLVDLVTSLAQLAVAAVALTISLLAMLFNALRRLLQKQRNGILS